MPYVEPVAEDVDVEASGLLDGLEGKARAERAELIAWLLERDITVEQIREAFAPMVLASRRLLGDDGVYVSARETSEKTGIDLELLQRVQRAMGLPRVDDPDAVVHLRADAEAAAHAQRFVELGFDPDQIVMIVRELAGLGGLSDPRGDAGPHRGRGGSPRSCARPLTGCARCSTRTVPRPTTPSGPGGVT